MFICCQDLIDMSVEGKIVPRGQREALSRSDRYCEVPKISIGNLPYGELETFARYFDQSKWRDVRKHSSRRSDRRSPMIEYDKRNKTIESSTNEKMDSGCSDLVTHLTAPSKMIHVTIKD
jgi:hypothetical protein